MQILDELGPLQHVIEADVGKLIPQTFSHEVAVSGVLGADVRGFLKEKTQVTKLSQLLRLCWIKFSVRLQQDLYSYEGHEIRHRI